MGKKIFVCISCKTRKKSMFPK